MKIVDGLWRQYMERVMPVDAPQVQVQECRRAFYAGAHGVMAEIARLASPGDDVTPADDQLMESILAELVMFSREVGRGRA